MHLKNKTINSNFILPLVQFHTILMLLSFEVLKIVFSQSFFYAIFLLPGVLFIIFCCSSGKKTKKFFVKNLFSLLKTKN